jgi:hypothetical protein
MGDGTKEKPYTRKDVLGLIKKNSGKAEGLNISGKWFEREINLSGLNLEGIDLSESHLIGANLKKANLRRAQLERAELHFADLEGAKLDYAILINAKLPLANLKKARLDNAFLMEAELHRAEIDKASFRNANLEGADLEFVSLGADFSRACLWRANLTEAEFPRDANFEEVWWGDCILEEEKDGFLEEAKATYHHLKIWYIEHNAPDIAAKFYYREKEIDRKLASEWYNRMTGWFSWAFFGHGEGWKRILIWIAGCISFFTLIYFFTGTLTLDAFLNSLYYSAISFITLGYGSLIKATAGWMKGLGVFEAFLGFFMMTLFLVTFVRKWTR